MRTLCLRLLGVLVAGLLSGEGAVRAEFLNWSYSWSISPHPVLASGTGSVAFALHRPGQGAPRLLVAALSTTSSASVSHPDRYNAYYTLTLHLNDIPSHRSGNLVFRGHLQGTLTATSSHLFNTFSTPTEHLTLGGHTYYVTLRPSFLALAPPGAPLLPLLTAQVNVVAVRPRPLAAALVLGPGLMPQTAGVDTAPEPSGFVLASLAAPLFGLVVVRPRHARGGRRPG